MQGRQVMSCDIPGAFLHSDIDEIVHIKFEGEIAELLVKVDPELYTKYVEIEKGKKVIYAKLQKALYGTLQAALLFWKDLSGFLVNQLGFTLNPYDTCVANKMINGKQCTICWHVDDLKLSHVEQDVLETIYDAINERYGKEEPVPVTRGKVHNYLGMTLDYTEKGKVKIIMTDYIDETLAELPPDMDGEALTPAAAHLFDTDQNSPKLATDAAEMFHTNIAKLLYLSKRACSDIQLPVAFLSTRVVSPDRDDYGKLRRCMQYLRGTKHLPLILEATGPDLRVGWWIDASFAVHRDMKSHTSGVMSLGGGTSCAMCHVHATEN